jgi:hypothetical protein
MGIATDIAAEADKVKVDLRKDAADLLAALHVNTNDEIELIHGVLLYLIRTVAAEFGKNIMDGDQ